MESQNDYPEPKAMPIHCPECDEAVSGDPYGHLFTDNEEDGPPLRWTLLRCSKGYHPLFVLQQQLDPIFNPFNDDEPLVLYPPHDRPLSTDIPDKLREAHEEARRCFQAKAYLGAVAMSGRTIEGACKLHGIPGKTLAELLKQMKERELIDGRMWDWANMLRGLRNTSAHFDNEVVSRQDAADVLAYSEALLDYLYVLSARFEALKKRREPPTPSPGAIAVSKIASEVFNAVKESRRKKGNEGDGNT